jgi:hypothetical protein
MTMSSYWMPAPALGLVAALAVVGSGSSLQAEPPEAQGAAEKPVKLGLELRVTPVVSFAPSRIRAIAELKLPEDRAAEFYCPSVEWDWGDLTESAETNECEPYEAGVSDVRRVFSAEHVFQSGGRYRVTLRLKRNRKVLVATSTTVTVRPGVRDAPYDGPEP